MTSKRGQAWKRLASPFIVATALCLLAGSCSNGAKGPTKAEPVSDIVFLQSTSAPIRLTRQGDHLVAPERMVVTIKLATTRDVPVRIRGVEAIRSPIDVKYLGFTHCRPGCVGGGDLNENKETVDRSIEGKSPVLRPNAEDTSLVFTLALSSQAALKDLAASCVLRIPSVPLRLSDGRIALVGPAEGNYVLGVHVATDSGDLPPDVSPRCKEPQSDGARP